MKSKHFAGVLILTAAVSLSALNPGVVAKASGTTLKDEALQKIAFNLVQGYSESSLGDGNFVEISGTTQKLEGLKELLDADDTFKYGFGETTEEAIKAASEGAVTVKSALKQGISAFVKLPKRTNTDKDIYFVMLTASGAAVDTVTGKAVRLEANNEIPTGLKDTKDVASFVVPQNLEYREGPVVSSDLDSGWMEVPDTNVVIAPNIEAGASKVLYFRTVAKGTKLASSVAAINYTKTKKDGAEKPNSQGGGHFEAVPLTGGTSTEPKKDEPKKEEPKKDEPAKKDEAKKEEPKTDGMKKSDDTANTQVVGSNTEAKVAVKNTKKSDVKVSATKIEKALETGLKVANKSGEVTFTSKALEKVVGDEAKAVTVTLKTSATKVTNKVKSINLASRMVFALNIKSGNKALTDKDVKGSKINVALKVNLGNENKNVYVVDLSSGKKVKAKYNSKTKKVTFVTSRVGEFVLTNK